MKKKIFIAITVFNLIFCPRLSANETSDLDAPAVDSLSSEIREAVKLFRLSEKNKEAFSLRPTFAHDPVTIKRSKAYANTGLGIMAINAVVWSYDRFILRGDWTKISLRSISRNFQHFYEWDDNSFRVNQFEHPYHGALYYSAARIDGLNLMESAISTLLGSLMWEFLMETNRPSANDTIMTTLGGITLGEVLLKISYAVYDEGSRGPQKIIRQLSTLLINPVYGFHLITGKDFKIGDSLEKAYYDLNIPIGMYSDFTDKISFLAAFHLENKKAIQNETSKAAPYDWFSADFTLGMNKGSLRDKEILTTGLIYGKKVKSLHTGFFGIFDYIDTYAADKMSAVGFGPGFISIPSNSQQQLYIKFHGLLSLIFGGSHSSIDPECPPIANKKSYPYQYGPGIMGRAELELGKADLGSISNRFSQYWVHSIHSRANAYLSALSSKLKIDLSKESQIGVGYNHYFRYSVYHKLRFSQRKNAIFVLYILKF